MPPFLTKAALHASGVTLDADDRVLGTCPVTPSFHLAYAREADKMTNLLGSVPDTPSDSLPSCRTCALVSNAGVLRKRECAGAMASPPIP